MVIIEAYRDGAFPDGRDLEDAVLVGVAGVHSLGLLGELDAVAAPLEIELDVERVDLLLLREVDDGDLVGDVLLKRRGVCVWLTL